MTDTWSRDGTRRYRWTVDEPAIARHPEIDEACRSCGAAPAPMRDTPDGRVRLCPACAAAHDIGCP